uniref:Uncharacterized protein n=1 Tax=Glossina palpalis gambiensis TaxID=67801 RepID=A0A1B0ANY0_9MUSC
MSVKSKPFNKKGKSSANQTIDSNSSPHNSSNTSSQQHNLDDIKWLMYLEAHKRVKDNEANIKRQVELANKNLEENMLNYNILYAKFASLLKLSALHEILQRDTEIELPLEETEKAVENIKSKLNSNTATGLINITELEKFKKLLDGAEDHENISVHRSQVEDLKNTYESIQLTAESIKASLDVSITQGIDYFVEQINLPNAKN